MVETRPRLTESEFMSLPDDGRKYELVGGEVQEAPTNYEHEWIGMRLTELLLESGARRFGDLLGSGLGCRMRNGDIRAPDLSFVRSARAPMGADRRKPLDGAPDLAVEIISPWESRPDMARNVGEYFESGAEQIWQVFPGAREVVVFTGPGESRTLHEADSLDAPELLPGFQCRVADIFA
jgi:Uma2 family endonuclease